VGKGSKMVIVENVKEIVAGYYHTITLMNDGTVKAWGTTYMDNLG